MPNRTVPNRTVPAIPDPDDDLPIDDSCAGWAFEVVTFGDPCRALVKAIEAFADDPSGPKLAYSHPADKRYDAQDARQQKAGEAYAATHHPDTPCRVRTRHLTVEGQRRRFVFVDRAKASR